MVSALLCITRKNPISSALWLVVTLTFALIRLAPGDPEAFLVTPHWRTSPHVLVWLRAVGGERLRELLVDAWRGCATKRQVRELGAS